VKESEPRHRRGKRRLRIIKELVACRQYQYSAKVQNFIQEGVFDLEDMERCVLGASAIQKVEPDDLGTAIDGCKYTIVGVDAQGLVFTRVENSFATTKRSKSTSS
jgi:hypothetical protein